MRFLLKKTARQITTSNLLTVKDLTSVSGGSHGDKDDDPKVETETTAEDKSYRLVTKE